MGGIPCGEESGEASRRKENGTEESCSEKGGKGSGKGGEEDFASKEIGGEEIWTEEDGPGCCTGLNGNWRTVDRWRLVPDLSQYKSVPGHRRWRVAATQQPIRKK